MSSSSLPDSSLEVSSVLLLLVFLLTEFSSDLVNSLSVKLVFLAVLDPSDPTDTSGLTSPFDGTFGYE